MGLSGNSSEYNLDLQKTKLSEKKLIENTLIEVINSIQMKFHMKTVTINVMCAFV